tara:strand:+ start:17911 stop:18576 length:666 start_codon:yes stop_codon:yes gene_type:complete
MKILELFAGSRSIGKIAEARGHKVFSVDVKDFEGIDLSIDIEDLTPDMIPFNPDMIWASPPCTTYSIAGIRFHRPNKKHPQRTWSDFAYKSDRLVKNTLKIIKHFNCIYYIENPRGLFRKQSFIKGIPRTTVWYCKYGDIAAKPTDIFTNNLYSIFNPNGWIPRDECHNGNINCHHEPAPRGNRTGTQGKKGNYERSKIPSELCIEIIKSTEKKIYINELT